jgi:hypothetical protein
VHGVRPICSWNESTSGPFFKDPKSDFQKPWLESWLPVLTNGAGDFVVYETQGSPRGQLITYWHDEPRRTTAHPSLRAWAEKLLNEFKSAR